MSILFEFTPDQKADWDAWVKSRPKCVRSIAKKYPPNRLYLMKSTGQRVTVLAYSEDGTVRVNITGQYNATMFDRQVFGVKASDLEECDLPSSQEALGTLFDEIRDPAAWVEAMK